MMPSRRRAIATALGAAALVLCAPSLSPGLRAQKPIVGNVAPEIDLPVLSGGRFKLSKLRGKAAIVSFWGTWCPPCREEFPELVRLHNAHANDGLVVVGVNGRNQERNTKNVQAFVEEFRVSFTIALDQRGRARREYRLVGLPTTVFVDTAGVIRRIHRGPISREELDRGAALILPSR